MTTVAWTAREPDTTQGAIRDDHGGLTGWFAGATLLAALTELTLLRLVTRTAIHIPGIEEFRSPYHLVSSAGRFAFYAASVLVAITLALLVRVLAQRGMRAEATASGAMILAAVAARLGLVTGTALTAVVGLTVVTLSVRVAIAHKRLGPSIGLFGAAFLAAALHALAQNLSGAGSLQPGSTTVLLFGAETLLVVALVSLHRVAATDRRDRAIGVAAGLVVFGVFAASSATTKMLMLWTFGLSGYFPAAVYAVAAGVLAMVLSSTSRHNRSLALTLGLLATGGLGIHSSYQSAMVVCALALLTLSTSDRGAGRTEQLAEST